jgi:hypothetical protein
VETQDPNSDLPQPRTIKLALLSFYRDVVDILVWLWDWLLGRRIVDDQRDPEPEHGLREAATLLNILVVVLLALLVYVQREPRPTSVILVIYLSVSFLPLLGLWCIITMRSSKLPKAEPAFNYPTRRIVRWLFGASVLLVSIAAGGYVTRQLPGQFQPLDYRWQFDQREGLRVRIPLANLFPAGVPLDVALRVDLQAPLRTSHWSIKLVRFVEETALGEEALKLNVHGQKKSPHQLLASANDFDGARRRYFVDVYLHPEAPVNNSQIATAKQIITDGRGLRVSSITDEPTP